MGIDPWAPLTFKNSGSALSAAFFYYIVHTAVGNGAMNKFGTSPHFYNQNVVILCRHQRNERSAILATTR
jgi:hypothetical protein